LHFIHLTGQDMRLIALIALLSFTVSLTAKTPGGNSPLMAEKSKTYHSLAD